MLRLNGRRRLDEPAALRRRARERERLTVERRSQRAVIRRVVGKARGRVCPERALDDGTDEVMRNDVAASFRLQRPGRDDLLDRDDEVARGERRGQVHAERSGELDVAGDVGALRVQQKGIEVEGGCRAHRNAGHRIGRDPGERASIEDVGADGNLEGQRRQSLQGCLEALRHRERRQFLDLDPALLESAPEARRKAEDVKAREAEHHLPDGFCLQEKLER